ncbi:MAG: hypothetical protein ACRETB_02355 [Steroidobacteraceae bacterium]
MRFRFKAFGLHILCSACVLTLVVGGLYAGWYRWPGWYLAGMRHIALLVVAVDVAIGPLLTLVVASPTKSRRELARDIGVIVVVQLAALAYGSVTLWRGRPVYYVFAGNGLHMVQAFDLKPSEIALGRRDDPSLAPEWHCMPRWVWAPLPQDKQALKEAIRSMISGGVDLPQMPRYFKPWNQGLPTLRKHLRSVVKQTTFPKPERQALETRMKRLGIPLDKPDTMLLTGRGIPLLAVFDPTTLRIAAILAPD